VPHVLVVVEALYGISCGPPEDAECPQQRAVIGLIFAQQPVSMQQAALVVEEYQQAGVRLPGEVMCGCVHHGWIPLQVVQVIDDPVKVGCQVVEHDKIRPLCQLHQLGRGSLLAEHDVRRVQSPAGCSKR